MRNRLRKKKFVRPLTEESDRALKIFICISLVIATLAVYLQILDHGFIYFDDIEYITQNWHIKAGFTPESITWAFTSHHAANWHPITWFSHMLDYQLYGSTPKGHLLTNLGIHIASVLLLFIVFLRMTGALWQSGFVAALFALHPLNVESIAWISERKNVLSTFFWLLTLWAYIRYTEKPTIGKYGWVALFLALGLMSKPMLVTLPFVLLLLDYWPLNRWKPENQKENLHGEQTGSQASFSRLIQEKIPLFVLTIGSIITTFMVQKLGGAVKSVEAFPVQERIVNAFVSYLSYLQKMVWPSGLSIFYPHPENALPVWKGLLSALLLLFLTLWVIRKARSKPYVGVGWFWYLGTLIPVIGLVQVGAQAMADRYAYVPLIGIFIIIAWGLPDLLNKWRYKKKTPIIFAGLLIPLMVVTWMQVGHWKDGVTLWKHAIKVQSNIYPEFARAYNNLGFALKREGRFADAITQYKTAIKINPEFSKPYNNLGNVLRKVNESDEAIVYFKEAIRVKPDNSLAYINLGSAMLYKGEMEEAITHFRKAIKISPDNALAYSNLGTTLAKTGKLEEAIIQFKEAIRVNPGLAMPHTNIGIALAQNGKSDEAIVHFRKAIGINPDYALAHFSLGNVLFQKGETQEAVTHFREAVRLNPRFDLFRKTLEAALL
ncbi:MAG: tetratricopeptide repeat protein [Nitrospina sp.]|nr:tetratricopeptide repeat protein [Nitrospina sp.]